MEIHMNLWICEKPSQASDIAKVLGVQHRADGYIETKQGVVTWAFGHLLEQFSPEDYDENLKKWRADTLPIIPECWKMKPTKSGSKQLRVIGGLLKKSSLVVISTDADREGESIGREILEHFHYQKKVQRLWLSALDEISVQRAIDKLMDGKDTLPLYHAAKARAQADWLYGMNLTRAASLAFHSSSALSVGRVQTPTLGLLVQRDMDIESFSPKNFYELTASIQNNHQESIPLRHKRSSSPEDLRIYSKHEATCLAEKCHGKSVPCSIATERKHQSPPKLFSLSGLQKECNAAWAWSADKTLKIAQALYETHKATTYPRSDCSFLPEEQERDIPIIVHNLAAYDVLFHIIPDVEVIRKSVFNTTKVTAHHAIIPTRQPIALANLSEDEKKAYILISTRYLMSISPDFVYDQTKLSVEVQGVLFEAQGKVTVEHGWKISTHEKDTETLPPIKDGSMVKLEAVQVDEKKTTPPKRYTEGNLITDMATIAKFIQEAHLKSRLKETSGIGTEATRASIIEVLKARKYIEVKGKQLVSTKDGRALIQALPDEVSNPGNTAVWEDSLEQIAQNTLQADDFVRGISVEVRNLIQSIGGTTDVRIGNQTKRMNPPTSKMLALAKKIAKSKKKRLPKDASNHFEVCKAFLDEHLTAKSNGSAPSEKQISFAKKLAQKHKKILPEHYDTDRKICSQFIDGMLKS